MFFCPWYVAHKKLGNVRDLTAYLFTALHRAANRCAARRSRAVAISPAATDEAMAPAEPAATDCVDWHRLQHAIAALPDQQREVLALKIDGELTLAQIAEVTGVSVSTVASRYHYALKKLRTSLVSAKNFAGEKTRRFSPVPTTSGKARKGQRQGQRRNHGEWDRDICPRPTALDGRETKHMEYEQLPTELERLERILAGGPRANPPAALEARVLGGVRSALRRRALCAGGFLPRPLRRPFLSHLLFHRVFCTPPVWLRNNLSHPFR